jgi:hypothetical protein
MTSNLNNQYDQLLDYLETHQSKRVKKPETSSNVIETPKIEPIQVKQLLEDSKIHSFIPNDKFEDDTKSLGFSIRKFTSMMRSKLIEEHKKLQSYERPYISFSELYTCIRQCYYYRMRYPININKLYQYPYLYLLQKVGNEIHNVIQSVYDFSETEKTIVSEKYKVKGRVDAIRENFLFEIKSIDELKFKNAYIKEHYIQANCYAYVLNTEYDYKIDTITIIYVIRNLKRIVAYDVKIDFRAAEPFLHLATILRSCIQNVQVPDPFGSTEETCKYCDFKEQCSKDKPNDILPAFMVKPVKKEQAKNNIQKDNGKTAFLL